MCNYTLRAHVSANPQSRADDLGIPGSALRAADVFAGKWPHCFNTCSSCLSSSAIKAMPLSGRAWFCRFLRFARLSADRLSRRCRLDAERFPRGDRCDRGLGLGSEERAAARTELRFVPGHADRDAVDIRNVRAAKAKRIVGAGLLLLGG